MYFSVVYDSKYIQSELTKEMPINGALLVETLVRKYCHTLLNSCLANCQSFDNAFFRAKRRIVDIILHHFQNVVLMSSIDVSNAQIIELGKSHQQALFNPIDNDKLEANAIVTDVLTFSNIQSLLNGYILIDKQNAILREIYKEMYYLVRTSYTLDELNQDNDIIINDLFTNKGLGNIPNNDDLTIINKFCDLNNADNVNSNIRDYLIVSNKTATSAVINVSINSPYSLSDVIDITYTIGA
jgi:hypothetical protein